MRTRAKPSDNAKDAVKTEREGREFAETRTWKWQHSVEIVLAITLIFLAVSQYGLMYSWNHFENFQE